MLVTNEWHRLYLRSEWRRRRERRLRARAVEKEMARYRNRCKQLEHELEHTKRQLRSQQLTISSQQNVLGKYDLPPYASFRLCKARCNEMCPLSRSEIHTSFLPFAPTAVYNPARPEHMCIELGCGHRFSAMWVVNLFVQHSTFQCPVCSSGPSHFSFRTADIPAHLRGIFRPALE